MQRMGTGVFVPRSSGHQPAAATRPSHAHTALQPADAGSVSALSDADACSPLCVPVSIQHSSGIPSVTASHTDIAQIPGPCALSAHSALSPTGPNASTHGPLGPALPASTQAERRSLDSLMPQCPRTIGVPAAAPVHCPGHSKPPLSRRRNSHSHYGPAMPLFATIGSQTPEALATGMPLFAAVTSSSPQAPPAAAGSPFAMHAGHLQAFVGAGSEGSSSTALNSLLQLQAPSTLPHATSVDSVLRSARFTPATIPETWYTSTAGAAAAAAAAVANQQTLSRSSSMPLAATSSVLAGQPASILAALSGAVGSLALEGSPEGSSTALTSSAQLSASSQSSGLLLLQDALSLADTDLQQMSEDDIAVLAAQVAQGKMAQMEQLKAMQQLLRQEVISLLPLI